VQQFLAAGLAAFTWVALCNATLTLLQTHGNFGRLFRVDLGEAPLVFLLSSTVLWFVLLLVIGVTGRFFVSCAAVLVACGLVGFANQQKLLIRNEPLLPSDLGFATQTAFMTDVVSAWSVVIAVACVVGVMAAAWVLGHYVQKVFPRLSRRAYPSLWRRWLVARATMVLVSALVLTYVAQFNQTGNVVRAMYDKTGITWAYWFQKGNYLRNGPVAGFLYNLSVPAMDVPSGYSERRMSEVAARWERGADRLNAGATSSLEGVNVVIVLSESFSDPTKLEGVTLERDPIPFVRQLMASTPSGTMLAQHFGGGTANMEFEALTGQSLSQFLPQSNTPYSMTVRHQSDYPSIVGYLKSLGHTAVAIHPYHPGMYSRSEAYDALGFDDFVTEEDMASAEKVDDNRYVADSSAFAEAMLQLRKSEGTDLLNVVTMQNHYPNHRSYDDPMRVSGVDPRVAPAVGNYARGLEYSDAALADFIDDLKAYDEPTAVIYYGDHQPALWRADPRVSADHKAMYRAPFLLWSNARDLPPETVGLASPIYFAPMLFRSLDLEVPPFYALLAALQRRIGAMENGRYYSSDGSSLEDPESDPATRRLLRDYRLVQYDFSVGQGFAESRMFPQ
jgi:phosphoglycerol transferase MdoB-like AlkP superfamily enzyme